MSTPDPAAARGVIITVSEVDHALGEVITRATRAAEAGQTDRAAWAEYDGLIALAELRPVPEPEHDFDDASLMAFGPDSTPAERTIGLAFLAVLAEGGQR